MSSQTFTVDLAIQLDETVASDSIFEASPYPHRLLLKKSPDGNVRSEMVVANSVHLIPGMQWEAKDLEVLYVGKGTSNNAQDRLKSHSTLQRILAEINSEEPDAEVFALVYAFEYKKNFLAFRPSNPTTSRGDSNDRIKRAKDFKPGLEQQIALIEASAISYFNTSEYNSHYIDFPDRHYNILDGVYSGDFAAILVQIDNTNIGEQRIFSQSIAAASTHDVVIDFRAIEGLPSYFQKNIIKVE